ncbi:MAG: DUF4203 domain-containing protein [bacterium]|nr:DUF4203 domain-containing protein [bacterium]
MTTLTIIAIGGVLLGLGITFFGYRLFSLFLNLLGIGFGGVVPAYLVSQMITDAQPIVIIGVGVIGALVGLGLVTFFFRAGLFFVGMGLGGGLAFLAIRITNTPLFEPQINWTSLAIIIVSALGGGLVAQFMQRPLLIVATSVQGAILTVGSGIIFLTETSGTFGTVENLQFDGTQTTLIIGATGLLALFGGLVQFFGMPNVQWQAQVMPNGRKQFVRVMVVPTPVYPAQGYYPPQGYNPQQGQYPPQQPPYPPQGYNPQQPPPQYPPQGQNPPQQPQYPPKNPPKR